MKTILAAVITGSIAVGMVAAQAPQTPPQKAAPPPNEAATPQPAPCGKPEVRSASQLVRDGAPVKFTVSLGGGDVKNVIYSWSISAGTITGGQGTATIDVDTTGAGIDKQITASVLLGGLSPECPYEANSSVRVAAPAKKIDEYGTLKEDEESAKLEAFLSNITPSEQAFVFVYAGRSNVRGFADTEVRRLRGILLKTGISADHLVTVNGGFREEPFHELWIVPIGAEPPRATPTVNAKEIVYPKPTPPVKKPGQ